MTELPRVLSFHEGRGSLGHPDEVVDGNTRK